MRAIALAMLVLITPRADAVPMPRVRLLISDNPATAEPGRILTRADGSAEARLRPLNHPNWRDGVRIGPLDEDRITAFIPPFEREDRVYQGTAGEGVAVDAEVNVYAAEGPNSLNQAGGAFTKYSVNMVCSVA